jgi:Pvc16 N-terminal domain
MIADIHETIKNLLFEHAGFSRSDVDVDFEIPNRNWIGTLTRPTINFFLYDLEEDTKNRGSLDNAYFQNRTEKSNTAKSRPRRMNLKYQVMAISQDTRDQHELLWRVLAVLMKYATVPDSVLPKSITELGMSVNARVSQPDDGPRPNEFWNALEVPPRPSLLYVLTAPLDLELITSEPLVLTRTLRLFDTDYPVPSEVRSTRRTIGGIVKRHNQPLVGVSIWQENSAALGSISDKDGRFVLESVPEGAIALRVVEPGGVPMRVVIQVPSEDYDIHLETQNLLDVKAGTPKP